MRRGKRMPSGQYFISTQELAQILNAKSVSLGTHGVFVTY